MTDPTKTEKLLVDVKLFLRSVLSAAAGTEQSKVCKEYSDMTGSYLPYTRLGYTDVYSLLVALEGEITRLEFCEKIGDNIVYAVLDGSKFSSKHAKKYANKRKSDLKHKSPAEIKAWKEHNNVGEIGAKKSGSHSTISNATGQNSRATEAKPKKEDWEDLNKLMMNGRSLFCLCVQKHVNNSSTAFSKSLFAKIFSQYGCVKPELWKQLSGKSPYIFVSFRTYMDAYRAWKEVHFKIFEGHRIIIDPLGHNNFKWNSSAHKVIVNKIPYYDNNMLMSTFVNLWATKDLLRIESRLSNNLAIIYFGSEKSAEAAIARVKYIWVNRRRVPLQVSKLNDLLHLNTTSPPSLLSEVRIRPPPHSPINNNNGRGLLPTPQSQQREQNTVAVNAKCSPPQCDTKIKQVSLEKEEYEPVTSPTSGKCGFCIDFEEAEKMFYITCKRSPRTCRNLADRVNFLVTTHVDGCRFWVIVIPSSDDKHAHIEKLLKVEETLVTAALKIQPPSEFPKPSMRGAALYSDNHKWYRCYILSAVEEKKKLTVFFVDYGNTEEVSVENFRVTYNDIWKLPPMAVPCKIHGLEMKLGQTPAQIDEAKEALVNRLAERFFTADVEKNFEHCQPHVVELKNITSTESSVPITTEDWLSDGYLQTLGDHVDDEQFKGCDETHHLRQETHDLRQETVDQDILEDEMGEKISMFPFNDSDLIYGMVAEVHNSDLLYLHLGELDELANLGITLQHLRPESLQCEESFSKGNIMLYCFGDLRRRVLILHREDRTADKVKVLHVDYGAIEFVPKKCLFKLDKELTNRPFQARPVSLAGVKSNVVQYANLFLKRYARQPIYTNIIKEIESGKLMVELFDAHTWKSLNLELISRDLGHQVPLSISDDRDEELSASGISVGASVEDETGHQDRTPAQHQRKKSASSCDVPAEEKQPRKISIEASNCSWDSIENTFPIQEQRPEQRHLPISTKINTQSRTLQWLGQHNSNTSQLHVGMSEKKEVRPITPPFPPPDIISSNTVRPIKFGDGVRLEGRCVYLGKDDQSIDTLRLDENNSLIPIEVDNLRQKWEDEKQKLNSSKKELEELLKKAPDEVRAVFKEKKKRKLQLVLRMGELERELNRVEDEYKTVVEETESLLAAV